MTDDLDDLFTQAAAQTIHPDAALVARVMADASALQPGAIGPISAQKRSQRLGLWAAVSALFGGGPALAAMGSAALAGLFFGVAQPASLTAFAGGFADQIPLDSVELIPSFETFLTGE